MANHEDFSTLYFYKTNASFLLRDLLILTPPLKVLTIYWLFRLIYILAYLSCRFVLLLFLTRIGE